MPSASDTAYPRLKVNPSDKELAEVYTPTENELAFARKRTHQPTQRIGLLLLLKTFQRLGYGVPYADISSAVVQHIARCAGFAEIPETMAAYDLGTTRDRHIVLVREFLGVTAYGKAARKVVIDASFQAARTRDDLPDIINIAIEELVRQRYELPAFSTFLRIARTARASQNRAYQTVICEALDTNARQQLQALFRREDEETRSQWDRIKREPGHATVPQLQEFLAHLRWLQEHNVAAKAFATIPEVKIRQFAAEAQSLDLSSLNNMPERKRFTLAAALIRKQVARTLDDVADMFLRQIRKIHTKAEEALLRYRSAHADRTDALIARLRDITLAYTQEGSRDQRLAAVEALLEPDAQQILADCTAHTVVEMNSHLAFLPECYKGRRSVLFLFLQNVALVATTQDTLLAEALVFLLSHRQARADNLSLALYAESTDEPDETARQLDISFVSDKWRLLVTGNKDRTASVTQVQRRYFELCVFSELMQALKSGDFCIPDSDQFSDYRNELISEEDYKKGVYLYGEQAGIAVEGKAFVERLRQQLETAATSADEGFLQNEYLRIDNGEPILKRLQRKPEPAGRRELEQLLAQHMHEVGIVDALSDTQHWLD